MAMLFHSIEQKYVDKPNIMYHTVTAYSPNIKFLGITLTEILKWNAHIDILCKSLNTSYFMIKPWRSNKSPLWILYYAYFQSHMKYSITFWFRDSYSKKFFVLKKKKVVYLIFGVKGHASCRNNFKAHKIVTVASIYILGVLCFIKKYHMNIKHNYHVHKYDTRGSVRLYNIFNSKQCFKYGHNII